MDKNQKIGLAAACVALGFQMNRQYKLKKRVEALTRKTNVLVQIEVDRRFNDIVKNYGRY